MQFDSRDIGFMFVMVPNKENVYSEYLPNWLTVGDKKKLQEIIADKTHENLIFDLTIPLVEAKKDYGDDLFYKTDSHWSRLGAYIAYTEIIETLNNTYNLDIEMVELISYDKRQNNGYELTRLMGYAYKYADFETTLNLSPSKNISVEYLTNDTTKDGFRLYQNSQALNDKRLLIVGDSFLPAMIPVLSNTFNAVYVMRINKAWRDDGAAEIEKLIADEKVDIVIYQSIERGLDYRLLLIDKIY